MTALDVKHNRIGAARIDDRSIAEVIGLAHGIIADGKINIHEADYLRKYLAARVHITSNPVIRVIFDRVEAALADDFLDQEEAADLFSSLSALAGGDFEEDELLKATTLPLCKPAPTMAFYGAAMCFTGTFMFGTRSECESAVQALGANPGSLTQKTRYLVIGAYATESWSQSSFGRKIEQAAAWRAAGKPISIVSEAHWTEQMRAS